MFAIYIFMFMKIVVKSFSVIYIYKNGELSWIVVNYFVFMEARCLNFMCWGLACVLFFSIPSSK